MPRPITRLFFLIVLLCGCDAAFVDLAAEPAALSNDGGTLPGSDAGRTATDDAGESAADAAMGDGGGVVVDAGSPVTPAERVVSRGAVMGWAGHAGGGMVELVERGDTSRYLRFGADFTSSAVPGPVVVLSTRAALGVRLAPTTDVELGILGSPRGAQMYDVPAGAPTDFAWVFCKPFGVEVVRAAMVAVP